MSFCFLRPSQKMTIADGHSWKISCCTLKRCHNKEEKKTVHNKLSLQFRDSSSCSPAGPRRVNHASVNIGDYIYSFGGYCSGEDYRLSRPMDVHVLNTNNLRWSLLSTRKDKKYPNVPFQRYGESKCMQIFRFMSRHVCNHALKTFCFA